MYTKPQPSLEHSLVLYRRDLDQKGGYRQESGKQITPVVKKNDEAYLAKGKFREEMLWHVGVAFLGSF